MEFWLHCLDALVLLAIYLQLLFSKDWRLNLDSIDFYSVWVSKNSNNAYYFLDPFSKYLWGRPVLISPGIKFITFSFQVLIDIICLLMIIIRIGIFFGFLDGYDLPTWIITIFQYFIDPVYFISRHCTVNMVVAISIERHQA